MKKKEYRKKAQMQLFPFWKWTNLCLLKYLAFRMNLKIELEKSKIAINFHKKRKMLISKKQKLMLKKE